MTRTRNQALFVLLLAGSFLAPLAGQDIAPRRDYQVVAERITGFITHEMKDKRLPGIAIALLDAKEVVWAKGFGELRADSLCRVGSISKLVTDTAAMQLVEQGKLDLDAPITDYLPDLKFDSRFEGTVTLRHLMSHHAGILREPPVGHYFQDRPTPTLRDTVASMRGTAAVYKPGSHFKYSNAGLAIVGRVVEKVAGRPFAQHVQAAVLSRCGMKDSSFRPSAEQREMLGKAWMWTYDGRRFRAPKFDLGMMPAADLYATPSDLVRFARGWFGGKHRVKDAAPLSEETQRSMFKPQFKDQSGTGFIGLGFFLGRVEDAQRVGHAGAMYGFASELAALPDHGLAVAVISNLDFSNTVPERIANATLRLALQKRAGKTLTSPQTSTRLRASEVAAWAGWYGNDNFKIELLARGDELWADTPGGFRRRLRRLGGNLIADDVSHFGGRYKIDQGGLMWGRTRLPRLPDYRPAPCRKEWRALVGEYGWDYDVLYVFERCGELQIMIEWFANYPIRQIEGLRWRLPDGGMYRGEQVVFRKNAAGKITGVKVGGVLFPRRKVGPADGVTFQIEALFPPEKLRAMAAAVRKPREKGEFRKPDLVDLKTLIPDLRLDVRYATRNNFMNMKFYPVAKAMMQRPAAQALARVQARLARQGMGLVVYDAYRPWRVTKMFWDATPEKQRDFVANPKNGSRHNRGCAVDLGLVDKKTGKTLPMVSGYDEFTPRAFPFYPGTTSLRRWHREALRQAMSAEGFRVYQWEWWHFDYKDWKHYPILDRPLK